MSDKTHDDVIADASKAMPNLEALRALTSSKAESLIMPDSRKIPSMSNALDLVSSIKTTGD